MSASETEEGLGAVARYTQSACRLCRREGLKLFLKGNRCFTEKCAMERRAFPPGQHGQGRRIKQSEYGTQLREKQKVKRIYGLMERQFRNTFQKAERAKGITGWNLLLMLERRLDTMVHRIGFATTHSEARQLVRHGHILVNGKRVNIPSYQVKVGDQISVRETSRTIGQITHAMESASERGLPGWVELQKNAFTGVFRNLPSREELTMPIQEQLIVELYSK